MCGVALPQHRFRVRGLGVLGFQGFSGVFWGFLGFSRVGRVVPEFWCLVVQPLCTLYRMRARTSDP